MSAASPERADPSSGYPPDPVPVKEKPLSPFAVCAQCQLQSDTSPPEPSGSIQAQPSEPTPVQPVAAVFGVLPAAPSTSSRTRT